MPPWPFRASHSSHSVQVKKWADEVVPHLPEGDRDRVQFQPHKITHDATTTSSTAVAEGLPLPVLQRQADSTASSGRRSRKLRFDTLQRLWEGFKERIGSGTAPSSSSVNEETVADHSYTYHRKEGHEDLDDDELDEVVVDRTWSDEYHSTVSHLTSQDVTTPEKSGNADNSSVTHDDSSLPYLVRVQHTIWAILMAVFSSRFVDEKKERHYQQEDWFVKKPLALVTSLWWICNWVLACVFVTLTDPELGPGDYSFYFGIAPFFSLPVVVLVMFNWPRDRQYLYQTYLILSIWCWPVYHVIYINACGLYRGGDCHGRDFLAIFYYTTALQTIAFFGLKLNRFPAALGALAYLLLASISIIPDRRQWIRSMINFLVYHSFLIYVHYMREQSERRLYTLRDQLKMQYKATQRAQLNERKASDSKRRLTSYVFHEVRVPLNTALLAVQNMAASGTVAKNQEIEFNALSGSLSMMSKVLNDVLDFNRMDMGKFESASKPYQFHQVMRSLFIPLRLATDARQLVFETKLDPNIDILSRALAYDALGESPENIRAHLKNNPDKDGVVLGDEARLRQIVTNLASNACKFTPPGGKMTITTKLVRPRFAESDDPLDWVFPPRPGSDTQHLPSLDGNGTAGSKPLSAELLSQHNFNTRNDKGPPEAIVVRIEVSDTGYGIRPKDMASNKLFTAFNQTEQGIQQGGKGTGLGLALVRQIVKLTGGRLGIQSKLGCGSTFWVELPLGVGRKTFLLPASKANDSSPPSDSSGKATAKAGKQHHPGLFETQPNGAMAESAQSNAFVSLRVKADGSFHQEPPNPFPDSKKRSDVNRTPSTSKSKSKHPLQESIVLKEIRPTLPSLAHEVPPYTLSPASDVTPTQYREDDLRNRPTHVSLPGPPTFGEHPAAVENPAELTPSTERSYSSLSSASPLTAYDNTYAHPGSASSSSPAVNIVQGMNVLVVDDDPLTRTLMTRILTRLGCQVTTAENGEMAVDLILGSKGWSGVTPNSSDSSSKQSGPILEQPRRTPEDLSGLGPVPEEVKYAVVFLDNQMPVMSGLKAVERLRLLGRKDFIVGVTGNALLSDQQEYLDAGADRILTKPVLERSLREVLMIAEGRRKSIAKERSYSSVLSTTMHDPESLDDPLPPPPSRSRTLNTSSSLSLPLRGATPPPNTPP